MIHEAIEKIVSKKDLTYDEAYSVMNEIMSGETSQVQNAAYLAALSTKSTKAETIAEISGSAAAMRDHALKVEHGMDVLEIVGTGGDHAGSINISTTAAMIAAAAGVKVAKHGNRAASSKSGAADCLEALGVNIDQPPEKCIEELKKIGSMMGSGGMIVMDEDDSMVEIAKFYLGFTVDESCGKCAPCRLGGYQMLRLLTKVAKGEGTRKDLEKIKEIGSAMQKGSLCGLGQTSPNPVLSTMKYFPEEYEAL